MILRNARFFALVLVAAGVAAPALAGPAGHGLPFTEETARRALEARTVKVAVDGRACAQRLQAAVEDRAGVAQTARMGNAVAVVFRSPEEAARRGGEVRAAAAETCA